MGTQRQPWIKWYWSDWRSDPKLRMCSLAARGLWAEMLALMQESDPYGHLLVSGRSPTDTQLAMLAGTTPEQIPELVGELESADVFSRTQKGVIFSRRMTRDDKKARLAVKNGKAGGNPTLCKKKDISPSDKGGDKDRDNGGDKAQKPEARGQKENTPKAPSVEAAESVGGGGGKAIVDWFLAERKRLWPEESQLPAPTMTLKTIAEQHLSAGGSQELIMELLTRGMEKRANKRQSAPTSLAAFANSIADGIAHDKSSVIKCQDTVKIPPEGNYVSPEQREIDRQRTWMALWDKSGRSEWLESTRGPPPGHRGCLVRREILVEFGVIE